MTTAYEQSVATSDSAERCILAAFAYLGIPETMIDLGCGSGAMCKVAGRLGCVSDGFDYAVEQLTVIGNMSLHRADLTDRHAMLTGLSADLVLCLEVAEHIALGEGEEVLLQNINATTERTLLFSAATPSQGGCGHVNEQPHDYWREKLADLGLVEDNAMTSRLRRVWSEVATAAWWYGQNVMVWRRPQLKSASIGAVSV